jgi:hypothetical protein
MLACFGPQKDSPAAFVDAEFLRDRREFLVSYFYRGGKAEYKFSQSDIKRVAYWGKWGDYPFHVEFDAGLVGQPDAVDVKLVLLRQDESGPLKGDLIVTKAGKDELLDCSRLPTPQQNAAPLRTTKP